MSAYLDVRLADQAVSARACDERAALGYNTVHLYGLVMRFAVRR